VYFGNGQTDKTLVPYDLNACFAYLSLSFRISPAQGGQVYDLSAIIADFGLMEELLAE
jgi:hypothetical protein